MHSGAYFSPNIVVFMFFLLDRQRLPLDPLINYHDHVIGVFHLSC